jgi:hypothetical protein
MDQREATDDLDFSAALDASKRSALIDAAARRLETRGTR